MHPKIYSRLVVCLAVLCLWPGDVLAETPREKPLIDSGWRFYSGDAPDTRNKIDYLVVSVIHHLDFNYFVRS